MRTPVVGSFFAAAVLAGLFSAIPSFAAQDEVAPPPDAVESGSDLRGEQPQRRASVIRDWTATRLAAARASMNEERLDHAKALLTAVQKRQSLNVQERSAMWRLFGHLHSAREDYELAADAFEKSLAPGGLAQEIARETRFNLAQVYMVSGDYEKAVFHLETWLSDAEDPGPQPYYVLAMACAHADRKADAVRYARAAVDGSEAPHEGRLQLLAVLLYEQEQYPAVLPLLEQLVVAFPKKTYWTQLVAVYSELESYEKALAVQESMYEQGLLESSAEHVLLAQLLLHNEIPYEAATVLEQGLEASVIDRTERTLELLASSYLQAQEYDLAIPPLEQAANLALSGDAWVRLGQVYLGRQQSKEARRSFSAALAKGNLADPGRVYFLIGMAEAADSNLLAAKVAFEQASEFPDTREAAMQWISHLGNQEALEKAEAELDLELSFD
ncbi:MAG: hypothetical protein ACI8TX_002932 [Hyphomicrobiaceae bacterium]|jgi:hypothetical protein